VQWEDRISLSTKVKKEQFSQAQLIKVNYLCVIGQQDQQMRQAAKTIQLQLIGINSDVSGQLSL